MLKFLSSDPVEVARNLIGCQLCRHLEGKVLSLEITEVEVYLGPEDLASHARFGKTKRNAVMFGHRGFWYVYLCYGMHAMLNLVTGSEGKPSAVLIRSVDGICGPGRLTKQLCVDVSFNGLACSKQSGLWIEPWKKCQSVATPRIGVDYAGPIWSQKLYRFVKQ